MQLMNMTCACVLCIVNLLGKIGGVFGNQRRPVCRDGGGGIEDLFSGAVALLQVNGIASLVKGPFGHH